MRVWRPPADAAAKCYLRYSRVLLSTLAVKCAVAVAVAGYTLHTCYFRCSQNRAQEIFEILDYYFSHLQKSAAVEMLSKSNSSGWRGLVCGIGDHLPSNPGAVAK